MCLCMPCVLIEIQTEEEAIIEEEFVELGRSLSLIEIFFVRYATLLTHCRTVSVFVLIAGCIKD